MDYAVQSEAQPGTIHWRREFESRPLLGEIHIIDYAVERGNESMFQQRVTGRISDLISTFSASADQAEPASLTQVARSSQRIILMDFDPLATFSVDKNKILGSLTPLFEAFCMPPEIYIWLTTFLSVQLISCFSGGRDVPQTFGTSYEESDDYAVSIFTWRRPCDHPTRDEKCTYLGTGCCTPICYHTESHTSKQIVVVLETPNDLIVLFSAPCQSPNTKGHTRSEVLSRDIMVRNGKINSTEQLRNFTYDQLCRTIIQDERAVVNQIEASLIHITQDIGNEKLLRESAEQWRKLIGEWRVHFHTRRCFDKRYSQLLDMVFRSNKSTNRAEAPQSVSSRQALTNAHDILKADVKHVFALLESTFNAIMQTLSILESQKAICEAEYVTRLTQLAFFFIPLSFVAGVCGMNLAEFGDGNLKAWIWAVTSVAVLTTTYLVFYFTDVAEFVISPMRRRIARQSIRNKASNTKNWSGSP